MIYTIGHSLRTDALPIVPLSNLDNGLTRLNIYLVELRCTVISSVLDRCVVERSLLPFSLRNCSVHKISVKNTLSH